MHRAAAFPSAFLRLSLTAPMRQILPGAPLTRVGRSIPLPLHRAGAEASPAHRAAAAAAGRVSVIARSIAMAPTAAPNAGGAEAPRSGYRMPPDEIRQIVDMPLEPSLSFSPDRKWVLQLNNAEPLPPIAELARKDVRLAGLRIDPEQNSRSRMSHYVSIDVVEVGEDLALPAQPGERLRSVQGIPPGCWVNMVSWSPDSRHVAFTLRSAGGPSDPPRAPLELWVADVETLQAKRLLCNLNVVFEDYLWLDGDTIVAAVIPEGRGPPPERPREPLGPKVQCNVRGETAQARTYQDLLKDEHDEALFDYYGTAELVSVRLSTADATRIGPPRLYTSVSASPDKQHLLVSYLKRPYSFLVPCGRFPKVIELWSVDGRPLRTICDLPLAESIPIAFDACRSGPRNVSWRADHPAQLVWGECQDGGDPGVDVSPRDLVYTLEAADPDAQPQRLCQTDKRWEGVAWADGELAIVYEGWWKTRRSVWHLIKPDRREEGMTVLFDRNYEDSYTSPGSPVLRKNALDRYVLMVIDPKEGEMGGRKLLMEGDGASPKGSRPFLDIFDLETRKRQRLWQCTGERYEAMGSLFNVDRSRRYDSVHGLQFMLTRETPQDPPQQHIATLTLDPSSPPTPLPIERADGTTEEACALLPCAATWTDQQITFFPHPYPTIRDHSKEVLRYTREDGVELNATLYLPPNYDRQRDGPLPCILWAYPREFKSKEAAGQVRRSPYRFSGIGSLSPTLWLARGFAVLDGPTMPIIGEGDEEANDRYVEQLTMSARAAVKAVVDKGVAHPSRIAVGGHSYGAFMTANLLAHCGDLFACGIARSGAYNRTLTPFGFQAEERTLWQAPSTYATMSPYMHANKIKTPLLLIHGEDDPNPGTFPMQSERFYQALKGHGAPTRLVILPHESHGYEGRESVMHALYEMDHWLERFCRGGAGASVEEAGMPGAEAEAEGGRGAKL